MTSQPSRGRHRLVALLAAIQIALVAAAPSAAADAAGPTDYDTRIISIEPPTPAIALAMIGGDSFVRLELVEPVDVVVLGYRGEHYLRFDADGVVLENRRSPSWWVNQQRYGTDEQLPETVDVEAPPQWIPVSETGAWAWHDHRTHWMNPVRPPGAEPGDQVLEATVPLLVDGEEVIVTVASWLLEGPSPWPMVLAGLVAPAAAGLAVIGSRRRLALIGAAISTAGLAVGYMAWSSVPSETEPDKMLWLLPAVGVGAAVGLWGLLRRLATTVYLDGLATTTGATLLVWGVLRSDALRRALIPSDAPAPLDRIIIVIALVVGISITAQALWGLVHPQRLIDPAATR